MLRHFLTLFFRNAARYKGTLIVNVVGLSSAFVCSILIYLWISDEYSVDKFHKNGSRLFQLLEEEKTNGEIIIKSGTAEFLGRALKDEIPEIELSDVSTPPNFFPKFTIADDSKHIQATGKFSGNDFFRIFSYDLMQGNPEDVLKNKNSIVLSETLVKSLFGKVDNVVGKTLRWNMQNLIRDVQVTGVFKDVPPNASEHFDFVVSMDSFKEIMNIGNDVNWGSGGPFTSSIVLVAGTNTKQFQHKLAGILAAKKQKNKSLAVRLFSDAYLYDHYENGIPSGGRITYLRLFALLGFIILSVASINFTNLITARASVRMKEIGIKKTIGASRRSLMAQYFSEAMLTAFSSFLLAIVMAWLILPEFNKIAGKHLHLAFSTDIIPGMLAIALLTGLFAGTYPALYLSGIRPVSVLKGLLVTSPAEQFARKGLVMLQFSVTAVLIVSVLVVNRQMNYLSSKNLGYDKENVLYFESSGNISRYPDNFLTALKRLPGVVSASSMLGTIIGGNGSLDAGNGDGILWHGKQIRIQNSIVNYGLLETLGMKLILGRTFSTEQDVDTMKIILNRAAVDALRLTDPIGMRIPQYRAEIVGVVEDFNYQSLHMPIQPFVFLLSPHYAMTILTRIRPGMEKKTLAEIKTTYANFNPGYPFDYGFLDDAYEAQYASESRVQILSEYLTALAIIISCLGLLSLVQFSVARKVREISIRKILGSGHLSIVYLLSGDFTKTVFAAIVIAMPVGYYLSSRWLDTFEFKITMEWWYFAFAGITVMLIAWMSIAVQVLKAAKSNPVVGLKD